MPTPCTTTPAAWLDAIDMRGTASATPLELLFDLTFVISFGLAASQFAHALAEGHYSVACSASASRASASAGPGPTSRGSLLPTTPTTGSSALSTMVQMIGVLVLALGLPRMFASIEHGEHLDTRSWCSAT